MENEKQYLIVTPPSLAHDSSSLINKVSEPTTKPKSHHQSELHETPNHTNSQDNEGSGDDDEILIVEVQLG
jgi:hypothetical protein